ncbi:MAG: tetratricopeptide repeat protein [Albidovulum sp.]
MGDGWIATFGSVADAAQCAMQMQDLLKRDGSMQMRTGVHVGDVAVIDGDVFGDAVNVAARLQEAAEPGAVAVSDAVYHLLDGTLRPSFDDAGARTLKNIPLPVRVWARGGEVAGHMSVLKPANFPELIIRPVHATDPRSDVQDLATALTGDLALQLDAVRDYSARVSQSARTDGYELKTSLRASGDRLRLEARLIAPDGEVAEALKIDGDLGGVFNWQDDAAKELCGRVIQTVFHREAQRISAIPEQNRSAAEWAFLGIALQDLYDLDGHLKVLGYLDRALELDPDNGFYYARALACLTSAYGLGYRSELEDYTDRFNAWAGHLDRLEPPQSPSRILLVWSQIVGEKSDIERVRADIRVLTRHLPFDPELLFWTGWVHVYLGDPASALECARRLNEQAVPSIFEIGLQSQMGFAYLQLGQFDKALAALERSYALNPEFVATQGFLISVFGHLGRTVEAGVLLKKLLAEFPDWSISKELSETGFVVNSNMEIYLAGLRKAGVPE